MAYRFSALSRRRLNGVHPDLVRVLERALTITPVDFRVQEGVRTPTRQAALYQAGATKTLNSRHLTGHAVDVVALVGGVPRWDWPLYDRLGAAVKAAAGLENVPIVWGGDWATFRDGPHFELPWSF